MSLLTDAIMGLNELAKNRVRKPIQGLLDPYIREGYQGLLNQSESARKEIENIPNYQPGYEYGTILPFRVNTKTNEKEFAAPSLLKDAVRAVTAPERAYQGQINPFSEEGVQEASNIAGMLQLGGAGVAAAKNPRNLSTPGTLGATVYHGSPHKFDKFDMSKIGTGEGAQAYGHGLYFAESPEVAKDYMRLGHLRLGNPTVKGEDIFSASNRLAIEGKPELGDTLMDFNHFLNEADNSSKVISRKADKQAMLEQFKARTQQEAQQAGDQYAGFYADRLKNIDFLEQNLDPLPASSFYKVDIPDETIPRMLDWDAAIADQPENVRQVLQKYGLMTERVPYDETAIEAVKAAYKANPTRDNLNAMHALMNETRNETGQNAYRKLHEQLILSGKAEPAKIKEAQLAEQLRKAGIPGIRYLDGNSRGAGGTSNYVLFDDQLPRILETNGQPTGLLSYADEAAQKVKKVKK